MYFPALKVITTTFVPNTMSGLKIMNFPLLTGVGDNFNPSIMTGCTGIFLTGMIGYKSGIIIPSGTMSGVQNLVLGTSGTLKYISGQKIELSGLNLNVQSVTGLLWLLTSLDGTNGTQTWGAGRILNMTGGLNAAPAGQGVTDKATLIARGATVLTN